MGEYIIAVRRDARDRAPANWVDLLRGIDGLMIEGAASPLRVQVRASPEALDLVKQRVGAFCHIEAPIHHHKA